MIEVLDRHLGGELAESWEAWRDRYRVILDQVAGELARRGARKSREKTEPIEAVLDELLPENRRSESLSRKSIWVLASTPGVSAVLVGMRRPAYVEDALAVLDWEPLAEAASIYESLISN